jgi:ABC-type multidrug transport system fused ATPase/permease subunit
MQPAPLAFERVKKMLSPRIGSIIFVRFLSVLDAVLVLSLFIIVGLLLALAMHRGFVILSPEQATTPRPPEWIARQLPNRVTSSVILRDTGLYPAVANNQTSASPPTHRVGARLLRALIVRVRPLLGNIGALLVLLATGLALLLALAFVRQLRKRIAIELAEFVADALRRQLHRQMFRLGQSALPHEGTGPVVNLFTRDVNDIRDGLVADFDKTYRIPVLAVGLLVIALVISVPLTIFLMSLGGLCWLVARLMDRSARQESDAAARDAAVQLCLLQEDLAMLRTVRVFGMEHVDKERFDEHLENFRKCDGRRLRTAGATSPTTFLLVGAAAIIAIGSLGYAVLDDSPSHLSAAAGVVLACALLGLIRPLRESVALRRSMRQAGRASAGIFEYLERRPELLQAVSAQFLAPLKERISFENVTLEGVGGRTLLAGVSTEIPAKSRTAVVSLDEPAKLAFVCLIPRLIDPKVGRVRMDGTDLRDITLESLRAQVATVLQADLVFSDSVLTNIGLGDPSYGLPRIVEAAKVAHAHNFIQDLPDGYDTVIGPLGHYLRPDEQYRVALARAFLHDPSIVIIEEPTSPLDDEVKQLIDDTIDRLAPGRTLVFLPHRLSTIRKCDQVLVIHNGRIEAAGAPRELQHHSKLYRHIQYVEFNQFVTGEIEAGQMNA